MLGAAEGREVVGRRLTKPSSCRVIASFFLPRTNDADVFGVVHGCITDRLFMDVLAV